MPATAPAEAEKSVSSSSAVPLGHRTYLTLLDKLGSFYVNGKKYLFCKYGLTGANDDREREGPVPKKLSSEGVKPSVCCFKSETCMKSMEAGVLKLFHDHVFAVGPYFELFPEVFPVKFSGKGETFAVPEEVLTFTCELHASKSGGVFTEEMLEPLEKVLLNGYPKADPFSVLTALNSFAGVKWIEQQVQLIVPNVELTQQTVSKESKRTYVWSLKKACELLAKNELLMFTPVGELAVKVVLLLQEQKLERKLEKDAKALAEALADSPATDPDMLELTPPGALMKGVAKAAACLIEGAGNREPGDINKPSDTGAAMPPPPSTCSAVAMPQAGGLSASAQHSRPGAIYMDSSTGRRGSTGTSMLLPHFSIAPARRSSACAAELPRCSIGMGRSSTGMSLLAPRLSVGAPVRRASACAAELPRPSCGYTGRSSAGTFAQAQSLRPCNGAPTHERHRRSSTGAASAHKVVQAFAGLKV